MRIRHTVSRTPCPARVAKALEQTSGFWHLGNDLESLPFTALLALLIGTLMGMLGGGGSILLVPVLLYVLKLPPRAASAVASPTAKTGRSRPVARSA